jgi:hypothetical protein
MANKHQQLHPFSVISDSICDSAIEFTDTENWRLAVGTALIYFLEAEI